MIINTDLDSLKERLKLLKNKYEICVKEVENSIILLDSMKIEKYNKNIKQIKKYHKEINKMEDFIVKYNNIKCKIE